MRYVADGGLAHAIGYLSAAHRHSVAILTAKIPVLAKSGFWAMMHEAGTDYCMVMGLLFLLLTGAGRLSLDARAEKADLG